MASIPIKRILRLITWIISGVLLGSLPVLPLVWAWKAALAIGIFGLNAVLWSRLFRNRLFSRPGCPVQEDICSTLPPDENLIQKEEISSLTREFDRICTDIDSLKEKIELLYSKAEQKNYYQTVALNNMIRQLRRDANQDSMTGLANRRHFSEYSLHLFQQTRQDGLDLACVMIDIDNFKKINDLFSHAAGDCVIVMMGEILKASVRQGDLCARFGGDEFVLLLQNCSLAEAWHIAERIRRDFTQKTLQIIKQSLPQHRSEEFPLGSDRENDSAPTGLSIGIATRKQNRPDNLEQLIQMADKALYQAKQSGRNCNRAC